MSSKQLLASAFVTVAALVLLAGLPSPTGTRAFAILNPAFDFSGSTPTLWVPFYLDNFSGHKGAAVDGSWLPTLGTRYPGGSAGFGNGEVETATNSTANISLDGAGHLAITPVRDAAGGWSSGRLESKSSLFEAPPGGELELAAMIKQPDPAHAVGYWPAFWALGAATRGNVSAWPAAGELDMLESVNGNSTVSNTFSCGTYYAQPCNPPTGLTSGMQPCSGCTFGFHKYSVIIDRRVVHAEQLRFLTDDVVRFTIRESTVGEKIWVKAVDHGFYLILNVAMGGNLPNNECGCVSPNASTTPGSPMLVDWVEVNRAFSG